MMRHGESGCSNVPVKGYVAKYYLEVGVMLVEGAPGKSLYGLLAEYDEWSSGGTAHLLVSLPVERVGFDVPLDKRNVFRLHVGGTFAATALCVRYKTTLPLN
jgi:hypothetical protein